MTRSDLEYGSISRQVHIDATPQVVYEVVSRPEHIAQWWADEADVEPSPGRAGVLVWRARATTRRDVDYVVELTVVEAVPGERFSFRWVYPEGVQPDATNSMLVTFTLAAEGEGTVLTVTEEGMREQGWEAAMLEEYYASHEDGWSRHLAELITYVAGLSGRDGRP